MARHCLKWVGGISYTADPRYRSFASMGMQRVGDSPEQRLNHPGDCANPHEGIFFQEVSGGGELLTNARTNRLFQTEAAMSESTMILAPVVFSEAATTMSANDIVMIVFIGGLLLFGLIVIVGCFAMAGWNARQEARRAEREAELKKHMLDRGLSVDEIERLIRATAERPKKPVEINDEDVDALGELGGLLGGCKDAKPSAIEEILAIARTADPKMRRAMVSAVTEMRDNSEDETITDEQIRAVVRALAHPAGPATQAKTPVEDLAPLTGTASRISDAFHLPE